MFEIGFWELALILVLALIVIGPERLPGVARTLGRWVGRARRYIEGVKSEVEKEFDTTELKRILHNQEVQIRELQGKLNSGTQTMLDDASRKVMPPADAQYEMIEEKDFVADAAPPKPDQPNSIAPVQGQGKPADPVSADKDKPV